MNKPVLWIVNQYSITPEYPASTRHCELARMLSNQYDVKVWGSNFIHPNKAFRFSRWTLFKNEPMEGFEFHWLGANAYRGNGMGRMINMLVFACVLFLVGSVKGPKPHVIIGSSPPLFTAFSCMLLARFRRSKFVLEVRDLWPDSLEVRPGRLNRIWFRALKWMERVLYGKANAIVTLTEGIQQEVVGRAGDLKPITFIPNGVSMDLQSPRLLENERLEQRRRVGIHHHEIVFMYMGAHGPANDLKQLLQAMQAKEIQQSGLPIRLVLQGEGPEREYLINYVKEHKLESDVRFLKAVPKQDIHRYLSIADVFVICLKPIPLYEGALPNKLFDYMLHDKPILSTVGGEIEQFLMKYECGVAGNMRDIGPRYLPNRMVELANQVARGSDNGKRRRGADIIRSEYNREQQAERLAALIDQLLK